MNARTRALLEESVLPPLVALVVALVAGDLLIMAYGQAPGVVWRMLLEGTWGNSYGFGQVLYKATTLTCTGLAVAVGLRAGLFNIGAGGPARGGRIRRGARRDYRCRRARRRSSPCRSACSRHSPPAARWAPCRACCARGSARTK